MDWSAIASVLAERVSQPLAVLDKAGRIRLFNRGMEQALGWSRFEVEGQSFAQFCTLPETDASRWLSDALRGALRSYEPTVRTKAGGQLLIRAEFSLVGRGSNLGLLLTVTRSVPVTTRATPGQDVTYEISITSNDFGSLGRVTSNGDLVPIVEPTSRCYSFLYGLSGPCEDCPILQTKAVGSKIAVRHRTVKTSAGAEELFEVTTAEIQGTSSAHLRVRSVTHDALSAIHAAKIDQLAQRGELTPREREVLNYLLMGRTADDIAGIVGIAPRTVKHHQANILQKLGADSRSDLTRLLF